MNDEYIEGGPITAETLKLLRTADDVSFHFREGVEEPNAFVSVAHRVKHGATTRNLPSYVAANHKFTVYQGDGTSGRRMPTSAYMSVLSAKFHPQWTTAARCLKVGDILTLHWTGGDSRLDLKKKGLVLVEFDLEAARSVGKSGREERLVFRIESRLTPPEASDLRFPSGEYELTGK